MGSVYGIGDIHGQYQTLLQLLRQANLVDSAAGWCGGDATLWFLGDLCDRGPESIAVIDLVMTLQQEAPASGGCVAALMGNHEPLLLAAHRFGGDSVDGPGGAFLAAWLRNGGRPEDREHLTPAHLAWLTQLPAMALAGDRLLVHADALSYAAYGDTVASVNAALAAVLASDDRQAWGQLLDAFAERLAFTGEGGEARAVAFLRLYGGSRLIHGHTPIPFLTGEPPAGVTGPLLYAGGRCVDLDAGLYLGAPGFVYRLDAPEEAGTDGVD